MSIDRKFWEQRHDVKDPTWLTGSALSAYNQFFHLENNSYSGQTVLEIGIGLGHASKELSQLAREFYCADISQQALNRIHPLAKAVFLTTDISKIPPVDIAVCYLVLVHCDDNECRRIINDVNLAPGGTLFVHFSGPDLAGITERAYEKYVKDGSHFFRTREQIYDLVGQTNKRIEKHIGTTTVNHLGWFPHEWYAFSLTNK